MLLLDCGNTRLKWRYLGAQSAHTGTFDYHHHDLASAEFWSYVKPDDAIWLASVANQIVCEQVQQITMHNAFSGPRFARSEAMQAGLLNGYDEPPKLGIDRWLAMLAAWHECRGACIVIDAGSALTVDFVDHEGKHLGGHIVPGIALQQRTLLQQTAQVKFNPQTPNSVAPGRNTQAAVCNGSLAMAVGYLRFLLLDAWESSAVVPAIFITGGDAGNLLPYLPTPLNLRPHLVLDGLTFYANEHS